MVNVARAVAIAVFRNDLRLHDNAILHHIHALPPNQRPSYLIPLFVYDQRQVECSGLPGWTGPVGKAKTPVCKFWRTGQFRLKFLVETVNDLQQRLLNKGSKLVVRFGLVDQVAANLAKSLVQEGYEVIGVHVQKEAATEEVETEKRLEESLKDLNVPLRLFKSKPLVHPDDLPFSVQKMPNTYTPFRKEVEGLGDQLARDSLPEPSQLLPPPPHLPRSFKAFGEELSDVTTEALLKHLLKPLGEEASLSDQRSAFPYGGGETGALQRLEDYFGGDKAPVAKYKTTRNGLLGVDYSTKLSPFLALGAVSPRKCVEVLREHESRYGASKDTYWVLFELLWRDFFLFTAERYGYRMFTLAGLEELTDPKASNQRVHQWNDWSSPPAKEVKAWLAGKTGVPFIDANMQELTLTGFMSNRGRQNVASFLTKDLYYDWRIGAEFFEHYLLDYDPASNYGNWQYIAGTGNDPRASRQFNPIKQANDYDAAGEYVKTWLPQLKTVDPVFVHTPWLALDRKATVSQPELSDYPSNPIMEQASWKRHYGPKKREGHGKNQATDQEKGKKNKKGKGKRRNNNEGTS